MHPKITPVDVREKPGVRFEDTPFLERMPGPWVSESDYERVVIRMTNPSIFCQATLIGTFRTSEPGYLIERYMPCIDVAVRSGYCEAHAPAPVPPARPAPTLQQPRIKPVVTPQPAKPEPVPEPKPEPIAVAKTEEHATRPWRRPEIRSIVLGIENREPRVDIHVNHRGEWVVGGRVSIRSPWEDD